LLFGAALLTASVAAATDTASMEAFFGYNLVHFNPNTPFSSSFDLHGGDAQFVYNFTRHSAHSIGAVLDIGAVSSGSDFVPLVNNVAPNHNIDHTLVNFLLGPRYTFQKHKHLRPFAQVLFGGARASSSTTIDLNQGGTVWPPPGVIISPIVTQPLQATLEAERTGFAMIAGGGLDIKISKHVAFRPIGADYYLTRFPSFITGNDSNRNHFRYSAGVNFMFGAR
jgi:hypothetical protein